MLRGGLPRLWNYAQIHSALFALFHDQDIRSIRLDTALGPSAFVNHAANASSSASDTARVIVTCLGAGIHTIAGDTEKAAARLALETLVDVMVQATRGATEANAAFTSPNVLAELVTQIRPHLDIVAKSPNDATTASPLPLLSVNDDFAFVKHLREQRGGHSGPLAAATIAQVPDVVVASPDRPAGDMTNVLQLLAQQVTQHITTRHQRKRSLSNLDLLVTPTTEMFVVVLRALFDASASLHIAEQVRSDWKTIAGPHELTRSFIIKIAFRTQLFEQTLHRLGRCSTAPLVADRVAQFVDLATDLAVQGERLVGGIYLVLVR